MQYIICSFCCTLLAAKTGFCDCWHFWWLLAFLAIFLIFWYFQGFLFFLVIMAFLVILWHFWWFFLHFLWFFTFLPIFGTFGDFWQRRRRSRRRRNRAFYFLIFTQSIDFFYDDEKALLGLTIGFMLDLREKFQMSKINWDRKKNLEAILMRKVFPRKYSVVLYK